MTIKSTPTDAHRCFRRGRSHALIAAQFQAKSPNLQGLSAFVVSAASRSNSNDRPAQERRQGWR